MSAPIETDLTPRTPVTDEDGTVIGTLADMYRGMATSINAMLTDEETLAQLMRRAMPELRALGVAAEHLQGMAGDEQ